MKILGEVQVDEMLLRGEHAVGHMKPALEIISEDLFRVVEATFQSQGRRGGGSWKQLSEKWAKYKEAHDLDPRILYAREYLVDSMTVRGDPAQDLRITNKTLHLGSYLPYAHLQNYGGGKVPARPYIDFTEHDLRRWVKICEDYLIERMKV
jgi:phage gpG-like protein